MEGRSSAEARVFLDRRQLGYLIGLLAGVIFASGCHDPVDYFFDDAA